MSWFVIHGVDCGPFDDSFFDSEVEDSLFWIPRDQVRPWESAVELANDLIDTAWRKRLQDTEYPAPASVRECPERSITALHQLTAAERILIRRWIERRPQI